MAFCVKSIFVLMHELPLESSGGGVLLREILRYLNEDYAVTAIFPFYPHQTETLSELIPALAGEGIRASGIPLRQDWGRLTFTLIRLFSLQPGCVCAMKSDAACEMINELVGKHKPDAWLLVSPFAAAYLPDKVSRDQVRLYYTNVDEDIMVPAHGTLRQRVEGWLEKVKVRRFVRNTAALAGKRGAITENNAKVLTHKTAMDVCYVPPLMAPRALNRSAVEAGLALITTNYTYSHNRISMEWFLREVWTKVGHDVRLAVTGMDTSGGDLRKLCEGSPRVSYLGFISKEELEKVFERCAAVINPTISGSGFQIKMLDALARGLPLATTATANPLGMSLASSDNPIIFAEQIKQLVISSVKQEFQYQEFYCFARESWHSFLKF